MIGIPYQRFMKIRIYLFIDKTVVTNPGNDIILDFPYQFPGDGKKVLIYRRHDPCAEIQGGNQMIDKGIFRSALHQMIILYRNGQIPGSLQRMPGMLTEIRAGQINIQKLYRRIGNPKMAGLDKLH